MSWLFGTSETSQTLEQMTQKCAQYNNSLAIVLLASNEILDETHRTKLKEMLDKTVTDFLYYHPKIKEVNDSVTHYFSESEKITQNKQKLKESAEQILSNLTHSQLDCITELLTNQLLSTSDREKLIEHLHSQLIEFYSGSSELELNELSEKINNFVGIKLELESNRQDVLKKKVMMRRLASRIPEIMSQIKNSEPADWLKLLITDGTMDNETHDKYLSQMTKYTLNHLSGLNEDCLLQIVSNVMAHKQMIENNNDKSKDLDKMRKTATVKTNVCFLEHLNTNPPKKITKIINTRSVAIPDVFIRQMTEIHGRKVEELQLPIDDKIYVKESYSNGQIRLKGAKLNYKKVGTWIWYDKKGNIMAEYNYTTNKWTYHLSDQNKIKGHGTTYEPRSNNEEFVSWLCQID